MKKSMIIALAMALVLTLSMAVYADTIHWSGNGTTNGFCSDVREDPSVPAGQQVWQFNLTQPGSEPHELRATFDPDGPKTHDSYTATGSVRFLVTTSLGAQLLSAEADNGTSNSNLVVSHCLVAPQVEELTVTKTADTSYVRTHEWDIAKKVETENGYQHNGYAKVWLFIDGSGNETATWTVDVTYEGYVDSDWNVSGDITIENTGTLDANITSVDDVLAGTPIDVDCGVTFPYTLPVGETLTCTYDEDLEGAAEGKNEVTVTTEKDTYSAEANIVWGDPTTENYKTVNVEDISDLFGTVALGTVTAPNGDTFTYTKDFAWADYGATACGDYTYNNIAEIVETNQTASATLKVNVQCYVGDETAFAKAGGGIDGTAYCFIPTFSRWGWTNKIAPGTYIWPLWAGAAQCDTGKGTWVGTVSVVYGVDGYVTVTFNVAAPFLLKETHVYVGTAKFPKDKKGNNTVAPGQYTHGGPFPIGTQVYVIAHAVVAVPDPNFGP